MDYINITKDGFKAFAWDGDKQKYVRTSINNIFSILRCECRFQDIILLDIFNAVDQYPELKDFLKYHCWCLYIEEFHQEAKLPEPKDFIQDLEYLEIYHATWTHKYKGNSYDYSPLFHGVGFSKEDKVPYKKGDRINYSVSYCPINEISRLPIRLDHQFEIYSPEITENKILFNGHSTFSVLDVLNAIYYEISFTGSPEDKVEFLNELSQTLQDYRSGKVKTIPIDEILQELKDGQ